MDEKLKYHDENEISLNQLNANEKAVIKKVKTQDLLKLRKLTAFGIMPGVEVTMIQRYPAFVIQVGFTQVALDNEIASEVLLSKL